jgi:uncharacterized RDD family membrane protein YckC
VTDLPPPPPSGFPPPPPPAGFGTTPPPGYTTTYGAPSGAVMQYAGFGTRFMALIVDTLITGLMFAPAIIALYAGPTEIEPCSVDASGNVTVGDDINAICEVPTNGTIAAAALLGLLAFAAVLVYYAKLEGGPKGQTIGKRAFGIRVADATTGGPIGTGRALGRNLFKMFISGNLCFLGYLWALWDGRKQTWHDKVVSSVVVRA